MSRVRTGFCIYGDQNTGKSHSVLELSALGRVYYVNLENKILETSGYNIVSVNVKNYFRFIDKLNILMARGRAVELLNDGMNYRKAMSLSGLGKGAMLKLEASLNDGSYQKLEFLVVDGFTNCFHTWKGAVTRGLAKDAFGENLDQCEPGTEVKVGKDGKVVVSHEPLLRLHRSGWSGWERIGQLMNDAFDKIFETAMECDMDVVVMGNQKDIEVRDGDDIKVVGVMPAFSGSIRHSYGAHFKHIGWVRRAKVGPEFPGLVRFVNPASNKFQVHCRASDGIYRVLSKKVFAKGDVLAGEVRLVWKDLFDMLEVKSDRKVDDVMKIDEFVKVAKVDGRTQSVSCIDDKVIIENESEIEEVKLSENKFSGSEKGIGSESGNGKGCSKEIEVKD